MLAPGPNPGQKGMAMSQRQFFVKEPSGEFREIPNRLDLGTVINQPSDVIPAIAELIQGKTEKMAVLLFDHANHIVGNMILTNGAEAQVAVYPRAIVREALLAYATGILIAHNHPCGTPMPSQADRDITRALRAACDTLDIRLLDHMIVAGTGGYFSFRESGLL